MTTPKEPCPELTDAQRAIKADQWPILDAFAETLPDFPTGEAIDCDTPDFIIDTGADGDKHLLGLELISLRPASNPNALRNDVFRNLLLRGAKELFELDIELPILVQLTEKPLANADDALLDGAAGVLVKMVRANVPLQAGETKEVQYWQFTGTPLFHMTDGLGVTRLEDGEPAQWSFIRDEDYALDIAALQSAIHHKSAKSAVSRRKCDELWLLIAAGYEHISSMLVLPDEVAAHRFESAFDRVFVFDCYSREITELSTTRVAD